MSANYSYVFAAYASKVCGFFYFYFFFFFFFIFFILFFNKRIKMKYIDIYHSIEDQVSSTKITATL